MGDFVHKIGENSLDFYSDERWQQVKKVSEEHSLFHWDLEFLDIFYGEDGKRKKSPGFDAVVGNPPYLNIRDFTISSTIKEFITTRFTDSTAGQWDLMIPFIHLGLIFLRQHGNLSMIVKDTIGVAKYTKKITEFIDRKYSLYQIDFFPNVKVFPNVGVNNKIIFVKKTKTSSDQTRQVLHDPTITDLRILPHNQSHNKYIEDHVGIVIKKNGTTVLGDICYCSYGLRPNNKENEPKFKKSDVLLKNQTDKHSRKYIEGKFLERYTITRKLFIEWNTKRVPDKCYRTTFRELYDPEKLLMARQKRVVAYSNEKHICDTTIVVAIRFCELCGIYNNNIQKYFMNMNTNNIVVVRKELEKKSKNFNLKYILAILNSNLIRYFLSHNSVGKIDSTPDDWKKIPIKETPINKQEQFTKIANQMLDLSEKIQRYDTGGQNQQHCLLTQDEETIKKQIHQTNEKINQMIYELYGLTEQEIQIVEEFIKTS